MCFFASVFCYICWSCATSTTVSRNGEARDLSSRSNGIKKVGWSVRCLRNSPLSNITFNPTGLKIYPNPVNRILNVNIDNYLINQPYTIVDVLGRFVLNGKLNQVESTINVEQLSKGIYYLKVSENNAIKFIKD